MVGERLVNKTLLFMTRSCCQDPFNMWAVIQEKGVPFLIMISKGFYAIPCLAAAGTRKMACYISEGITTYVGWPLLET
jgi:hypothetical protein